MVYFIIYLFFAISFFIIGLNVKEMPYLFEGLSIGYLLLAISRYRRYLKNSKKKDREFTV